MKPGIGDYRLLYERVDVKCINKYRICNVYVTYWRVFGYESESNVVEWKCASPHDSVSLSRLYE